MRLADAPVALSPTIELAAALISRPSLTPEDHGCQELIAERLAALGFRLEWLPSNGVTNLWATRGQGRPLLCFAGHTDVVPTGPRERWTSEPFAPTLRDGRLYGRGAADMKASLAAFVTAAENFLAACPAHDGRLAFLFTSDEEGAAIDGTAHVVETLRARGERIDYCVIGEPTSESMLGDTIKNGRRGSLTGRLIVHGVQGHVAYPQAVQNPIHLAAPALAELAGTVWDEGNEYFPPTSFQVSNIHGGTGATNVVPGSVEILFNLRHSTASTRESLQRRVEEILDRHGLHYELTWPPLGKPFLTPRGTLVEAAIDAIQESVGVEAHLSCTGGTSDGRFLADICEQMVELGPVNATIHTVDEYVAVDEFEGLQRIYLALMRRLLGEMRR